MASIFGGFGPTASKECVPKCCLKVVEVHEDACHYSISMSNGLLRVGDYLVGVNDHYPDDVATLAKLNPCIGVLPRW